MNLSISRVHPNLIILLTALVLLIPFVQPTTRHHRTPNHEHSDEHEFRRRVTEMQSWNCGTPKPRLVYVAEEHTHLASSDYLWFPPAAVVFRCEQYSGCCTNPDLGCQPTSIEMVSTLFKRVDSVTIETKFERLNFSNHTSCRCRPKS